MGTLVRDNCFVDERDVSGADSRRGLAGPTWELQGRQRRLFDALRAKDPKFASMYQGALQVLADEENPDRLALSAHGFRELMEKMGPDRGQTMNAKLQELRKSWDSACDWSDSFDEGEWQGEAIDGPLRDFLGTLVEFFESMKKHVQALKKGFRQLMRELDPYPSGPPQDLEEIRVSEWERSYIFFQSVCHHRKKATLDEVQERVDAIETLLHDYLVPRTFEVHTELDALIEEGERDANA